MSKTIDVYRDWLKITETARPLTHYQLLRLKQFEDDIAKVREHYRAMNGHVRKFATGEYAKESQDLLNELAKAMLCLTDQRRKGEYDAAMGRKSGGPTKARTFEQILLANKVVDQAALDKARNFAKAINVEVRDALVQQKLARPEAVLPAYAESIGLPYLDLSDIPLDLGLIARVPPVIARQHSCIPVLVDNKQLLMASPNPIDPNVEEELRLRFGMPVRTVLCTPSNINDIITKFVPRDGSAAEPAPAAAPAPAAPGQPAAPAAAPAKTARPSGPLTPEQKKERLMYSVLAMNVGTFTMIACANLTSLSGWIYAPLGVALAGVAFAITWKRMSRPR
jgi:type II secretion system (T2SS) protein E